MKYKYIASDKDGTRVTGELDADSREGVVNFLHEKELIVISIEEALGLNWSKISQIQIGGFSLKDKVIITKQLVAMLTAGLPLTQAMQVLQEQAPNDAMKQQLEKVYRDLQNGMPLSQAFASNTSIYNEIQTNLIAAGEKSGNLVEIMEKIAEDLEKSHKLRGKIRGALIYPAIIMLTIVVVVIILVVFMVPQMEQLYEDFGIAELPFVTNIIVKFSNFISSVYGILVVLLGIASIAAATVYYRSTVSGKRIFHRIFLSVPVFGPLNHKIQVAEFSRLLSLLLSSGVPIIDALNIVARSTSNVLYAEVVYLSSERVSKGVPLAVPLTRSGIFPPVFTRVVTVGEETGKLDQVLLDMANFYDNEVSETADNLTKLLEPFILLIVAGLVAFLAIAIYWPIYNIGQFV